MTKPVQPSHAADTATALYERSGAAAYGITAERFAAILDEILRKHFSQDSLRHSPSLHAWTEQTANFCAALRLEELALARACAAGNEQAWHDFISRYRQKLHRMALHITRDGAHAADLADSLFADLYGVNAPQDGQDRRKSKLLSYTGRGSLEGWLRTVLSQEYVNRYRRTKRLVSLDEESEEGIQFSAPEPEPLPTAEPRLAQATDEALAALSAEDRTVLATYYLDGRTLAEIARMLGVHESTISRKLDKMAKALRKQILAGMARRGMSRRQAEEAFEVDVRDLHLDIRKRLAQDSARPAFSEKEVEARVREGPG
jgi:RNA polymerase sigma-70 factor, ECF subfamily